MKLVLILRSSSSCCVSFVMGEKYTEREREAAIANALLEIK
uniref:Uncharacterized protein n=1 Tax=Medicago truncatula TaxID=3880 RepID=I3SYR0_MEDTR|nr:unknown [Medicago truncatula]